jgi:hypothetical protein
MMTVHMKLDDNIVNVKIKIASLWTSVMFIIIYLDYFHLYMPHKIEDIMNGRVFVFDISQAFLLAALAMVATPALMIFLSVCLSAKVNRLTNILIAAINIPLILFNLAGEAWVHMVVGAMIQVILLSLIIYYAWKWPRAEL